MPARIPKTEWAAALAAHRTHQGLTPKLAEIVHPHRCIDLAGNRLRPVQPDLTGIGTQRRHSVRHVKYLVSRAIIDLVMRHHANDPPRGAAKRQVIGTEPVLGLAWACL